MESFQGWITNRFSYTTRYTDAMRADEEAVTNDILKTYRTSNFMTCHLLHFYLFSHQWEKIISYWQNQLKIYGTNQRLKLRINSSQFTCSATFQYLSVPKSWNLAQLRFSAYCLISTWNNYSTKGLRFHPCKAASFYCLLWILKITGHK